MTDEEKETKEFRRVVLKTLRTLVRASILLYPTKCRVRGAALHDPWFWNQESDVWDWEKEMGETEEKLLKAESDLKE